MKRRANRALEDCGEAKARVSEPPALSYLGFVYGVSPSMYRQFLM